MYIKDKDLPWMDAGQKGALKFHRMTDVKVRKSSFRNTRAECTIVDPRVAYTK